MIWCLLFEYEICNISIKDIDEAKNSISILIKDNYKIEEFDLKNWGIAEKLRNWFWKIEELPKNWGIDWKIEELTEKLRNLELKKKKTRKTLKIFSLD